MPTRASATLESADLHYYGHSQRVGDELFEFVYGSDEQVAAAVPGIYTRYGDVTELLGAVDDKLVIYWSGDEVTLRFAPTAPARAGMRRYVLETNGYYKDDRRPSTHTVEPLPFAAMSNYPYGVLEHYPWTDPDHATYRETYNTRELP